MGTGSAACARLISALTSATLYAGAICPVTTCQPDHMTQAASPSAAPRLMCVMTRMTRSMKFTKFSCCRTASSRDPAIDERDGRSGRPAHRSVQAIRRTAGVRAAARSPRHAGCAAQTGRRVGPHDTAQAAIEPSPSPAVGRGPARATSNRGSAPRSAPMLGRAPSRLPRPGSTWIPGSCRSRPSCCPWQTPEHGSTRARAMPAGWPGRQSNWSVGGEYEARASIHILNAEPASNRHPSKLASSTRVRSSQRFRPSGGTARGELGCARPGSSKRPSPEAERFASDLDTTAHRAARLSPVGGHLGVTAPGPWPPRRTRRWSVP